MPSTSETTTTFLYALANSVGIVSADTVTSDFLLPAPTITSSSFASSVFLLQAVTTVNNEPQTVRIKMKVVSFKLQVASLLSCILRLAFLLAIFLPLATDHLSLSFIISLSLLCDPSQCFLSCYLFLLFKPFYLLRLRELGWNAFFRFK